MNPHRSLGIPGAAVVALSLAACATVPPPNEQFAATRAAIQAAEVEGAGKTATAELTQAREKLTAAQSASQDKDNERARRLAEEAQADAQLAQARASTARSQEGLAQAEAALHALREEANRPTLAPSAAQPATVAPVTPVSPLAPTR